MPASIDLSKAHRNRTYGDLMAVWSWINEKRALFLIPHRRARAPWFIVMEQAAHEWDDRDPLMVMMVISRAIKACEVLGFEPTPSNARKIIRIVNDAIPELVQMPSSPPVEFKPGTVGSMLLRADGKPIAHDDIRIEKAGVTYEVSANG